mmetsp:Transcript_4772/g.14201  ORF Transcript_4772/g.14201 Transcript_4772/m.14201 type:complete len:376 (-) Transcript_4772:56-1183(-)
MSKYSWKELLIDGKVKFKVPAHLELIKKVGSGAYGTVCSFTDPKKGEKLAVKKITDAFRDLVDGKRILREVKLLRNFKHDNIICILDMYPPDHPDFDDIYIVTDLMETDLHKVIYSKQVLNDEHHQYFSYQILRGLLYLHSANVVHGDLRPSCALVNLDCELQISDFRYARAAGSEGPGDREPGGPVNRWYSAPEFLLQGKEFTKSMDIWSVGCIHCELIGRQPIFNGGDHFDQLRKIMSMVGTPSKDELGWLPPRSPAWSFLQETAACTRQRWETVFAEASRECLGAVERMLAFSPRARATAEEAICLPYFLTLHDPSDEPTADAPADWSLDELVPTRRLLQNHAYAECAHFRPDLAMRDEEFLALRDTDPLLE